MELEKNIRRGFGQGLASTGRGYAPLHFFCELKEEHAEEVNLLIKLGVDVNAVAYQAGYTESNPKNPFTALQAAVDRGYSTITTLLLACAGIKTGIRDAEGLTPLMVACRKGHYAIVKQLLNFPLPTEFPLIWHGNTLLHDAARR
ncbi:E3 ubiquitin-protein ligase mib1, partial [Exophiala xenobiotica]